MMQADRLSKLLYLYGNAMAGIQPDGPAPTPEASLEAIFFAAKLREYHDPKAGKADIEKIKDDQRYRVDTIKWFLKLRDPDSYEYVMLRKAYALAGGMSGTLGSVEGAALWRCWLGFRADWTDPERPLLKGDMDRAERHFDELAGRGLLGGTSGRPYITLAGIRRLADLQCRGDSDPYWKSMDGEGTG